MFLSGLLIGLGVGVFILMIFVQKILEEQEERYDREK